MFCAQIIPQLDIRHLLTHWDFFFFLIWITVTYYFVQAALDSVTPMLIYVFKQKLREKTCCEEQPQQPRKEPGHQISCSFITYMCPLLTPYLSAVFLTFLQNPVVAFQMQDNITVGSAISSRFIIHFKQPAPHFHVVNDQLTENTDHLWSKDTKIFGTMTISNCSLIYTPLSQMFGLEI